MKRTVCDDPDQTITDIIATWPQTIPVFLRHRMLCVGCMIGPFHTIEDACREYHLDLESFCQELDLTITEASRH